MSLEIQPRSEGEMGQAEEKVLFSWGGGGGGGGGGGFFCPVPNCRTAERQIKYCTEQSGWNEIQPKITNVMLSETRKEAEK